MSRISIYRRRRRRAQMCVSYGKYYFCNPFAKTITAKQKQDACNDKDKDNNTNEINK
jgi:hypothetical protein